MPLASPNTAAVAETLSPAYPTLLRSWPVCCGSSPRSIDVRGLLCSLLFAEPVAPALRFALPAEGDAKLPAPPPPSPPPPAAAALPENSRRGLTFVAVRVIRPDTAIGCDSLC